MSTISFFGEKKRVFNLFLTFKFGISEIRESIHYKIMNRSKNERINVPPIGFVSFFDEKKRVNLG